MKQKIALKEKNRKQINGKFNNVGSADENKYKISLQQFLPLPVTVAERSKACTVFARSEPGIVRSNPTQGMDV
jgi:hypothetical protein